MTTSKDQKPSRKNKVELKIATPINHEDEDEELLEQLKDLDYAADYLTACLDEGEDVFVFGIRNVAKSKEGMTALATTTEISQKTLSEMLSVDGDPSLKDLRKIIDCLGLRLEFSRKIIEDEVA